MRLRFYADRHYWEGIGVEEVAKSVGYSPRRANSLFRTHFGENLGSYLRDLRMIDAKRSLDGKLPIDRVALSLSYTPRGFRKAFQEYFGVSPSQYLADGRTYEPYSEIYEYDTDSSRWGDGANPSSDGLWEYSCYDPSENRYIPMEWCPDSASFRSPGYYDRTSSQWYCQCRWDGYGMHPGKGTHAVKTFLCPRDGRVSVTFSFGRNSPYQRQWSSVWQSWKTPCSARLYLNGIPLSDEVVMTSVDPHLLTVECSVCAGDRISFHVDPMENHVSDGVYLYRQRISYLRDPE